MNWLQSLAAGGVSRLNSLTLAQFPARHLTVMNPTHPQPHSSQNTLILFAPAVSHHHIFTTVTERYAQGVSWGFPWGVNLWCVPGCAVFRPTGIVTPLWAQWDTEPKAMCHDPASCSASRLLMSVSLGSDSNANILPRWMWIIWLLDIIRTTTNVIYIILNVK